MSWREYVLSRRGFNRSRSYDFEHTRAIVYTLGSIFMDKDKPLPAMEDWWKLETDHPENGLPIKKTDIQKQEARLKKLMRDRLAQMPKN